MRRKRSLLLSPVRHRRVPVRAMLDAKRHVEVWIHTGFQVQKINSLNDYYKFLLIRSREIQYWYLHPAPTAHMSDLLPLPPQPSLLDCSMQNLKLQRKLFSGKYFKMFSWNAFNFREAQAPPKGSCSVWDGQTTRIWRIWRCLCRHKKERQSTGEQSLKYYYVKILWFFPEMCL